MSDPRPPVIWPTGSMHCGSDEMTLRYEVVPGHGIVARNADSLLWVGAETTSAAWEALGGVLQLEPGTDPGGADLASALGSLQQVLQEHPSTVFAALIVSGDRAQGLLRGPVTVRNQSDVAPATGHGELGITVPFAMSESVYVGIGQPQANPEPVRELLDLDGGAVPGGGAWVHPLPTGRRHASGNTGSYTQVAAAEAESADESAQAVSGEAVSADGPPQAPEPATTVHEPAHHDADVIAAGVEPSAPAGQGESGTHWETADGDAADAERGSGSTPNALGVAAGAAGLAAGAGGLAAAAGAGASAAAGAGAGGAAGASGAAGAGGAVGTGIGLPSTDAPTGGTGEYVHQDGTSDYGAETGANYAVPSTGPHPAQPSPDAQPSAGQPLPEVGAPGSWASPADAASVDGQDAGGAREFVPAPDYQLVDLRDVRPAGPAQPLPIDEARTAEPPNAQSTPTVGAIVFEDGSTFALDRDYVVGRRPEKDPRVQSGQAAALTVIDPDTVLSSAHALLAIRGAQVVLTDLGSLNGTHIAPPGAQDWTRLEQYQEVLITPGTRLLFGWTVATYSGNA
ncbi:FHA domain-containing protein [Cumulibacter soli]|uniref:FHA domain-containing protein n=1 Tax=Cumulibacter soli TaxID=2546344 RepID=UPI001ABBBE3E|nr:FHA domain-containing protein [Cumulibacter soli]